MAAIETTLAAGTHAVTVAAPRRAIAGWVMFEWACQPFYTLIVTFLFGPYFVNVVVGDKTEGQALWGYGAAVAGLLIAVLSPFLGAVSDGRGVAPCSGALHECNSTSRGVSTLLEVCGRWLMR